MERSQPRRRFRPWDAVLVAALVLLALYAVPRFLGPAVNEGEPAAVPDPNEVYDPVPAGEPLPAGYRPVTGRDRIRPIYAPRFRSVAETDWPEDTLVLGIALDGEAKAYPIRTLNHREMVLDRLGGTPILATW